MKKKVNIGSIVTFMNSETNSWCEGEVHAIYANGIIGIKWNDKLLGAHTSSIKVIDD